MSRLAAWNEVYRPLAAEQIVERTRFGIRDALDGLGLCGCGDESIPECGGHDHVTSGSAVFGDRRDRGPAGLWWHRPFLLGGSQDPIFRVPGPGGDFLVGWGLPRAGHLTLREQ